MRRVDLFQPQEILNRVPLLRRIVKEVISCQETRRKKHERLEELVVISRKFSSSEIQETMNSLRSEIRECKLTLESCEKEIRQLGGTLRDPKRGIVYFNSEKENRPILLIWDPSQPDTVSWHEVDESFADRTPIQPSRASASAIDYPEK